MGLNAEKIMCHGPCAVEELNKRTGKYITYYPEVNCECRCETCGWNPAEKERRLKNGVMKPIYKRINPETGKVVNLENVEQLCFSYPVMAR